jgi:thiamine biosynthesis lipoprotein
MTTFLKKPLMAGEIEFHLHNVNPAIGSEILEETYIEALRMQKIFNFYDSLSELSVLNKKRTIIASKELLEVLRIALDFCKKTNGAYDISLGKAILERKSGKTVSKQSCSYKNIKIIENTIIFDNKDVLIDLGSIAKGYILDKLSEYLQNIGVKEGLINCRGDIRVFGNKKELILIQHPRDKDKIITSFKIKESGIATSGDYNQYFGSFNKSHILGKKDLISVTVIAPTLTEAEVFSTSLIVLEKSKREKLIRDYPKYRVFTVDEKLEEKSYNGFSELISKNDK